MQTAAVQLQPRSYGVDKAEIHPRRENLDRLMKTCHNSEGAERSFDEPD
jgi:hypothetical protein